MPPSRPGRLVEAAYRLFLRAYPRAFRAKFGDGMTEDFLRLRAAAATRGGAAVVWLWIRTAADLVVTGVRERLARIAARYGWTAGGWSIFSDLAQDLRHGLRTLRGSPGYAAIVVLTLGLGIGVSTAMFSLVDGVLLAPLPYAQGDRIVHVRQTQPAIDNPDMPFSVDEIQDYRAGNHSLTDLVEYHGMTFTLLGEGEPELVRTGVVSARYFDVLGMRPILGRSFTEKDDSLGAKPVMLLAYDYWMSRFGGDLNVIGRGFVMNGKVHTVIGVLPPIPQYPDQNDVYMPTSQCPTRSNPAFMANRKARMMEVFGVLRPGVRLAFAEKDLSALADHIADEHPDTYQTNDNGYGATVAPLKEDLVATARPTLWILMATTALVLLIACANVASLALARAIRRSQELAVRRTLGAGRGRLIRQLLTESTMLGLLGGLIGIGLARASLGLLVKFAGRFTPRAFEATMDGSVLAFALAISLATGLFFGSVPALHRAAGTRSSLGRTRSGASGPSHHHAHRWLVGTQVALAFILLIGAGLLARTFVAVSSVDLGYDPRHVLSAGITLPAQYYAGPSSGYDEFFDELFRRTRDLSGVTSVARVQTVPLAGGGGSPSAGLATEEDVDAGPARWTQAMSVRASPSYFETMGIPILEGRGLTDDDRQLPDHSVVLSRSLAQQIWGGENPLGRRVRQCSFNVGSCQENWLTVVGVVGDVRMKGLESEPTPTAYMADIPESFAGNTMLIRANGELTVLGQDLAELVHTIEPDAALSGMRTLDAYVSDAVAPRRLTASLMGIFAGLALLVTLAGVAGVVAFTTSRRTHEIGVRLALGAQAATVLAWVLRAGMAPAVLGLGVGTVGALGLSRTLAHLVWGVPPTDVITFVGAGATLFIGALFACWLPARRAIRVDPCQALRTE